MRNKIIKIGVIGSLLLLILIGGFGLINYLNQPADDLNQAFEERVNEAGLSERSQAFYQEQQFVDGSKWQTIQLGENATSILGTFSAADDKKVYATRCFQIQVDFDHYNPRIKDNENECLLSITLGGELWGHMTAVMKPEESYASLSDHSGYLLRERFSDKYHVVPVTNEQFDDLQVFQSTQDLTAFIHNDQKIMTISFSETNQRTQEIIRLTKLEPLLNKVQLID